MSRVARVDRLGPIRFDRRPAHADVDLNEGIVARLTVDGFLRVDGRISGVGVYEYEDGEGQEWGELREPEEVFDAEALASFAMAPVTNDHPPVLVDAANIREYQCGQLGSQQRPDGSKQYVVSDMLITDSDLIEAIKSGKTELSCGYTCIVVADSGSLDGKSYAYKQTQIRGNHLSVVDAARGGPMCSLILDSKGAINRGDSRMKINAKKKDAKVSIAGVDYDVPDEVAVELARLQALAEGGAEGAVIETDEPEPGVEPAAEEEVMASKDSKGSNGAKRPNQSAKPSASDADKARIDALEATIKAEREESSKRIDARVNLVTRAREILGRDAKTDGVSDISLMRAVVCKVTPSMKAKVDGASLDYVTAAYECACDAFASRVDSTGELGELVFQAAKSDGLDDLDAIYSRHLDSRTRRTRGARKEAV